MSSFWIFLTSSVELLRDEDGAVVVVAVDDLLVSLLTGDVDVELVDVLVLDELVEVDGE